MVKKNDRKYIICIIIIYGIYDFSILLSPLIGLKIQIILGFFNLILLFFCVSKCMHLEILHVFLFLLVISINSSYTSIIGIPYSSFPLTWFLIANIIVIILCHRRITKTSALIAAISFIIFFLISSAVCQCANTASAIKQMINILLFLLIFSCIQKVKSKCDIRVGNCLELLYVGSVTTFSLLIIVQKYLNENMGIEVGTIGKFFMRISYASNFCDYSFATLYVASGFCLLFARICYKKELIQTVKALILMAVYMHAMLAINARTGLAALIFTVFLMLNSLVIREKRLIILIIEAVSVLLIFLLLQIMSFNRAGMFNGSGRIEGYIVGLRCLSEHFLLGSGFGGANYGELTGYALPHNFIIQYLAQFGITGTVIILIGIVPTIKNILFNHTNIIRWTLLTLISGAMFIPDIINSHYLCAILIIAICWKDSFEIDKHRGLTVIMEA